MSPCIQTGDAACLHEPRCPTEEERCSYQWWSGYSQHAMGRCRDFATLTVKDGKRYCAHHDPVKMAERRQKRREQRRARRAVPA